MESVLELWDCRVLGLIVRDEGGGVVTTQTGGYACLHPEERGRYLPLEEGEGEWRQGRVSNALQAYFFGPPHCGWCFEGISERDAVVIEGILHAEARLRGIVVDRSRLSDSHEAWVYVNVAAGGIAGGVEGEVGGVLVWENSD